MSLVLGAAENMVSKTVIDPVDMTQFIDIVSNDDVNCLTDDPTLALVKLKMKGVADDLSSLVELGVGTHMELIDPVLAMRGRGFNVNYADKVSYMDAGSSKLPVFLLVRQL